MDTELTSNNGGKYFELSEAEKKVVTCMRSVDDLGREMIISSAQTVYKFLTEKSDIKK